MSKNGFAINWNGLDKAFLNGAAKLGRTQELLENIGEALVSNTVKRFEEEKAPDGTKWKQSQRAMEEGGQTLSDTGLLKKSVTCKVADDKSVQVGSNSVYAKIHQFGGTIRPVKAKNLTFQKRSGQFVSKKEVTIPARPFIDISEEDKKETGYHIGQFIANSLKP